MPKRSLTVMHLRAFPKHQRRTKGGHELANLPGGRDLLPLYVAFVEHLREHPDELRTESNSQYGSIETFHLSHRMLFIKCSTGNFGETGAKAVDAYTHEVGHTLTDTEASVLPTRSLLLVPPVGESALLLVERAGLAASGSRLHRLFERETWPDNYSDVTLLSEPILETEAWLEGANLTAVDAVLYGWSPDPADAGIPSDIGVLEHSLRPKRGSGFLPQVLWSQIRKKEITPGRLLGFPDGVEPNKITVQLTNSGRRKSFEVGKESTPPVSYLLSDNGQPALTDDAFIAECLEYAKDDLFPRVGGEWQTAWNTAPPPTPIVAPPPTTT